MSSRIYLNEINLNAPVRAEWDGPFDFGTRGEVDGVFGYVLSKPFPPKKSTMFRDLYGVNSERSCANASVSYIREFPYVTSALSNGKQKRRGIVRGVRLEGTFSPSIARLLINVFLNLSREETES